MVCLAHRGCPHLALWCISWCVLARQALPTALQSQAQATPWAAGHGCSQQLAPGRMAAAQCVLQLARTPNSMAAWMRKGCVAFAMRPNNNIAGTEEEENCGSTQQTKYAKYLHLVESKHSSRVCYLYNFPKQAIELQSDFRPEIWVFSN